MRAMSLAEVAGACGGSLAGAGAKCAAPVSRVSTDTRATQAGDLFFALRGERFDAHDFVGRAAAAGAAGAVVARGVEAPEGFPLIRVADTLRALRSLAAAWRREWTIPVVAVGGSNGKTSTKELVAAVLEASWRAAKTEGNLNNHIGVPLTMLAVEPGHGAAVIEIGTNHPGEVADLAALARPDVAVLTNIGLEHLEFLKDEAGVAREEGALLEALTAEGTAVLNADDPWTGSLRVRARGRVLLAGFAAGADVRVVRREPVAGGQEVVLAHAGGESRLRLPLAGRHMAQNLALAVAAGLALGADPAGMAGPVAAVRLPGGRMRTARREGVTFLDDSYNANPSSMAAALAELGGMAGRKIAVLGTMGELGPEAARWHEETGRVAAAGGADMVVAVGPFAEDYLRGAGAGARGFGTAAEAAAYLKGELKPGDNVLLKASRSARFEAIAEALGVGAAADGHR